MNKKILVMAGILVALTGLLFVAPVTLLGAVACPGYVCVTHEGKASDEYGSGEDSQESWGVGNHCYVENPMVHCDGKGECCEYCFNLGYDQQHTVGVCKNPCFLDRGKYNLNCPV